MSAECSEKQRLADALALATAAYTAAIKKLDPASDSFRAQSKEVQVAPRRPDHCRDLFGHWPRIWLFSFAARHMNAKPHREPRSLKLANSSRVESGFLERRIQEAKMQVDLRNSRSVADEIFR
jgi:hypothetical protein